MGRGDFCTVAEVAGMLGVSASTVWRWVDSGKMPAVRIGPKAIRIRREDAEAAVRPVELDADEAAEGSGLVDLADANVPLTADERERWRDAIARAEALRERILRRRKGRPLSDSVPVIRAMRRERSRHLG
jgi:excisionase family DNA binding protein